MFKRIILLFMVASTPIACDDINYDSETRLVIEGVLTDRFGAPIPNQSIDIGVYNYEIPQTNDAPTNPDDIISYGFTDENGAFKMAIPAPDQENKHTIGLLINHKGGSFQNKEFLNIKRNNFDDYRLNMGWIALFKDNSICNLIIRPETDNPDHELRKVEIEGVVADRYVYMNPSNLDLERQVARAQTVVIHYEVADHSGAITVITQNSVNLNIGSLNSEIDYTLHY